MIVSEPVLTGDWCRYAGIELVDPSQSIVGEMASSGRLPSCFAYEDARQAIRQYFSCRFGAGAFVKVTNLTIVSTDQSLQALQYLSNSSSLSVPNELFQNTPDQSCQIQNLTSETSSMLPMELNGSVMRGAPPEVTLIESRNSARIIWKPILYAQRHTWSYQILAAIWPCAVFSPVSDLNLHVDPAPQNETDSKSVNIRGLQPGASYKFQIMATDGATKHISPPSTSVALLPAVANVHLITSTVEYMPRNTTQPAPDASYSPDLRQHCRFGCGFCVQPPTPFDVLMDHEKRCSKIPHAEKIMDHDPQEVDEDLQLALALSISMDHQTPDQQSAQIMSEPKSVKVDTEPGDHRGGTGDELLDQKRCSKSPHAEKIQRFLNQSPEEMKEFNRFVTQVL